MLVQSGAVETLAVTMGQGGALLVSAAGVEHLMLTAARKVYYESVEIFATKVIPHFRK